MGRILVVGEPGRRTDAALRWLALMGFADVSVLQGGIDAYPGELETGPAPPPPPPGPTLTSSG